MSRIELTDLPVSADLSAEEMAATTGSGPHVRVFSSSTDPAPTSDLDLSAGSNETQIGLLLPAIQKVR